MVNGLKTLLMFLGLTAATMAQDFKNEYSRYYDKYFRGEIAYEVYSYNYLETINDEHYISSLIAKDVSGFVSEDYPFEAGPIGDIIVRHDKESGWFKEFGAGAYLQVPTPDFIYAELYYMPYWTSGDAKVYGTTISLYPSDNTSVYGTLEYLVENKDGEKSSDISLYLSIDVEL